MGAVFCTGISTTSANVYGIFTGSNFAVIMTQCVGCIILIVVPANRAGVGGVACFAAGGFCYSTNIAVARGRNIAIQMAIAAAVSVDRGPGQAKDKADIAIKTYSSIGNSMLIENLSGL